MKALRVARNRVTSGLRVAARRISNELSDLEPEFLAHSALVRGYTMTSIQRQYSLYQAVRYVVANKIEGSFVECGVWKGGSSLLAALTFSQLRDFRDLWLFDTFAGMTPPTEFDAKPGLTAVGTAEHFKDSDRDDHNDWCYASLAEVKQCLRRADYPEDKLHFVVGDVTRTIPDARPERIAILRLDTDFYDSTRHELEHLYDLLAPGGLLIIDDYGSWDGARKAVDEFFAGRSDPPFLARVDETARIAQKR